MNAFKEIENKILIFDGAMGTMLQQEGLGAGELPEVYNIEHPEIIQKIHESYIKAGAQIITTNTFQASELKLEHCSYSVEQIIEAAVKIARKAKAPFVALDIGPLGKMMKPLGELSFEEAYQFFKRQVEAGTKAGVDFILLETFSDLYEAKAAILAAKENSNLPIFCTMTFQQDGRTFLGTNPLTAVSVLQGLGVDVLGMNCSLGPEEMISFLPDFLRYAKVPVMVQSNAGLPQMEKGQTLFPVTPKTFGHYAEKMAKLGVQILGGCCGTTPEYIYQIKQRIGNRTPISRKVERMTCACSSNQTVILDDKTTVIGERINPTGKKRLKEALRNHQFDILLKEAIYQVNAGAQILDVNVGLPEIDEKEILPKITCDIQEVVDVPLQIDSADIKALEATVRVYNGKPIINSVNGKEESMKAVFPIAKKYGAALICLTLDENGIPKTAQGRLQIAEKMMKRAIEYGIPKEDLIVDCLVMTASAQQSIVKETLKAVNLVKTKLGVKTTLGISNISFGLPNRELLNQTFLAAALGSGLDAPILDPLSQQMMDTIHSFRVLNNEDREAQKYITTYQTLSKEGEKEKNHSKDIQTLIVNGMKVEVEREVEELLKKKDGEKIIQEFFIPALDKVGKKYELGEFFLPQLLRSAEAVKQGLDVIKARSIKETIKEREGKILLATVKGDIHDIGKNIVKMLLENYGFTVIDMGKDVEPKAIVERVKKEKIELVGLSALMTTTVKNMERTIQALKKEAPYCKVMVGGAVLTLEYAKMVGADYYAADGQAGIRIAKEVFTPLNSKVN